MAEELVNFFIVFVLISNAFCLLILAIVFVGAQIEKYKEKPRNKALEKLSAELQERLGG